MINLMVKAWRLVIFCVIPTSVYGAVV